MNQVSSNGTGPYLAKRLVDFWAKEQGFADDNLTVQDIASMNADQKEGLAVFPGHMPTTVLQSVIGQPPRFVPVFFYLCEPIGEDAAWLRQNVKEYGVSGVVCVCVCLRCGCVCVDCGVCAVCGAPRVVYGAWCVVCGLWCGTCGVLCVLCVSVCLVCGLLSCVWCVVCDVKC